MQAIEVEVLDLQPGSGTKRDHVLTVTDRLGTAFEVVIWETHDVQTDWHEGEVYRIDNARGEVWNEGASRQLHSTNDVTVSRIESGVTLVAMGDTHIGRETRPDDTGEPNRCARQFLHAVTQARDRGVDAVLHTGDIFDDRVRTEDLIIARAALQILERNGIPFYYIFGNHENERGTHLLEEFASSIATHVADSPVVI